jgi:hypothetical protein
VGLSLMQWGRPAACAVGALPLSSLSCIEVTAGTHACHGASCVLDLFVLY